jgi:cystathionine beta-lyase
MEYDFDEVIDRRGTASLKWDKYRHRDVIPLWVADMDFRSPPAVLEALHRRVSHAVFGYTSPPDELNHAVCEMLQKAYDWKVRPEWLVWLPGLVTGLNVSCRAVGEEGDEVLTAVPVYPPFLKAPGLSGRRLVKIPLREDNQRWTLDFDRIEAAITPRTRLFILCNPHNPVGRVFTRRELSALISICDRHGIVICSDEIHCGLILDHEKKHLPTASIGTGFAEKVITLMAPSKTYNVPGLGCAFAVLPGEELRRRFQRAMDGIVPMVNAMGYTAALAAYRNCARWQADLLDYLRGNRALLEKALRGFRGISMAPVEATYLAWLDVRALELQEPQRFFEAAGVGLQDGRDFDGPGFLRLNFGCPRALLQRALERMAAALKRKDRLTDNRHCCREGDKC